MRNYDDITPPKWAYMVHAKLACLISNTNQLQYLLLFNEFWRFPLLSGSNYFSRHVCLFNLENIYTESAVFANITRFTHMNNKSNLNAQNESTQLNA